MGSNMVEVRLENPGALTKVPEISRLLFGVQLEVTSLLLEAERRKLNVLQRELQIALAEGGSIKAKEHQKQELIQAISKIQAQHDHLEKEYRQHAMGALRSSNTRGCGKSGTVWFPAVGGLPLREDPGARPPGPVSRLAEPAPRPPQFGSTFGLGCPKKEATESPRPPPGVRGGVQVLPPVLPPRTKPKPPLPPKRDELTRLTTVKKDPVPVQRPPQDTGDLRDTRSVQNYVSEVEACFSPDRNRPDYDRNDGPVWRPMFEVPGSPVERYVERRESVEEIRNGEPERRRNSVDAENREIVAEEYHSVESRIHFIENLERQNSFRKAHVAKDFKDGTIVNGALPPPPPPEESEKPEPLPEKEPEEECVYATINPETKSRNKLAAAEERKTEKQPETPPEPPERETSLQEKTESSDSEEGATADIWVRTIDSPVKKPPSDLPKVFRSYSTSDEKTEKFQGVHRASFDNSILRNSPKSDTKPQIIVEYKEPDVEQEQSQQDKKGPKIGTESLPCSRPSSRTASRSSSPALFSDKEKQGGKPRMSAAEALGVVAKPCPRPPPGNRLKNALEFRRQSLSNLSDSKLSVGSTSQQLWSSFGECQEYRRHERARGQSADSRTLQRLRSADPPWDNYSSTLSRIGKYAKAGERSGSDRPKSTCNCGGHGSNAPPPATREVGKRTFSVEELTTGRGCEFVRGTSRSSLGKSPRVTFALSEDEMGATGGSDPPRKPVRTSRPPHDPDDRYFPLQSNRSQPAIGLKQTPKARVGVAMDDAELQETVESILGKGARVVDCEKKSSIREEEVVLVNGCPISLEGEEGAVIREALLHGTVPHTDLLNRILMRAGILACPARMETSLSVKSSVVTREQVTVARGGRVVDGRSRQTKQEDCYTSSELWEPTRSHGGSSTWEPRHKDPLSTSSSTSDDSEDRPDYALTNGLNKVHINGSPTIFGTVASDQTPKDAGSCRRSLPQTTPPGLANGGELPCPQDVNPAQDNSVVYRDGNLISGRLEALVQHMVPTLDYYPDRAFLFAFLLTSRLFIKPHELLGEILALSESQQKSKQTSPKEKTQLLSRMVQLLGEWSETFPYDFRDERVMSHVREVAHRCVSVEARQEVSLLLHNLLHRLTKLEQYEAFLHSIHTEASTNSLEALSQNDVSELCGTAVCLAQQLTHIEIERLSYIGPEEFVQAFAKESPNLETSFKDMKKTRNLESYVSWFNRLSYFVATEVCKHLKSKKQRVRVVEFWIETGRECFNIGNFNSLMAIIAGLNMSPVLRLKRTWSKVQGAKFSVLEHQMDPSCNFSSYRSTLKAAVWRSAAATDDSQRIVIPFFSLLVKDLYFLNEGCSNKLPNGHINFEKFWQLAKQVTEFITWKQVHCPFPKSPKVITYLQATPVLNEDALALASFECEPPENHEKERYKALKAELGT